MLLTNIKDVTDKLETSRTETLDAKHINEHEQTRIKDLENEIGIKKQANSTQQMRNEIERLNTELQNSKAKYQTSEKAKDEAFTRLSKEAGAKLSHGNAAITDLSDDNRPNKLAERFNEVYDNAWTDAFEELTDAGLTEEKTIKVLYEILQNAYNYCSEREEWYRENIKLAVHTIPCAKDSTVDGGKISPFIRGDKLISDVRLTFGSSARNMMSENFLGELDKCMISALEQFDKSKFPNTTEYSRQCASLCWLMRIRDPRVSINFKIQQGDPFDGAIFRQYRKTGKTVAYPVWPVLELYDEGPLLAKGVVQPE